MSYLIEGIDVQPFLKAQDTFERFRQNLTTDQEKTGAIQAFEFSYELAWKTMKRLLQHKGIDVRSPRDCFRESALVGMITNPMQWFAFIDIRNITVYTYEEKIVQQVIAIFDEFSSALAELRGYLEHEKQRTSLFGG